RLQELNSAGVKHYRAGRLEEAASALGKALEVARRLYPRTEFPDGDPDLAASLNNLASVLQARGKFAEAEPLFRDALDMKRRHYRRQDDPDLALSLNNLANVLEAQGKYAEAEPLYRDAVAMCRRLYPNRDHPDLARGLNNLAGVLQARG